MNAFANEDLEEGDLVVISKDILKEEYHPLPRRTFVAGGGFGMQTETMGTAVFVTSVEDGKTARFEGTEISVDETVNVWEQIGRQPDGVEKNANGCPEIYEQLQEKFGEVKES